jgi:hypothetical protein
MKLTFKQFCEKKAYSGKTKFMCAISILLILINLVIYLEDKDITISIGLGLSILALILLLLFGAQSYDEIYSKDELIDMYEMYLNGFSFVIKTNAKYDAYMNQKEPKLLKEDEDG